MRRLHVAAGLVWVPVAITAGTWPTWSGQLPDRIATHWNGTGAADQFSNTTGFWVTMLIIGIAAAGLATGAVILAKPAPAHFLVVASGAVTGATAGIWVSTATTTLADPIDARLGWHFLYFVLGMAWGAVIWATAGRLPHTIPPVTAAVDPLDLGPTERAAYSTTLRAPVITIAMAVTAAVAAVLALTIDPSMWLILIVPALAALTFGRIRVTVDRRGLRVVAGLLGVTIKHIPLAEIASAGAEQINPVEWGGWGYRITVSGRSALVLRSGPGLVVHQRDGRSFAVTLDHPETPAALLTALQMRADS
ncbi:DUF1648 domain-containing protein [Actinoplanes sp. GCM10030250]|uniref:DUF1648 domain-containing protein n=1 Tax=Actinoplanes sp. GCM10030250 TaxID=3273376 RepID=UPI003617DFE1